MGEERRVDLEPLEDDTQVYGSQQYPQPQPSEQVARTQVYHQRPPAEPMYLKNFPTITTPHLTLVAAISTGVAAAFLILTHLFIGRILNIRFDLATALVALALPALIYFSMGYLAKLAIDSRRPLLLHVGTILGNLAPATLFVLLLYLITTTLGNGLPTIAFITALWAYYIALYSISKNYYPPASKIFENLSGALGAYAIAMTSLVFIYFLNFIVKSLPLDLITVLLESVITAFMLTYVILSALWFLTSLLKSVTMEVLLDRLEIPSLLVAFFASLSIGLTDLGTYQSGFISMLIIAIYAIIIVLIIWISVAIYNTIKIAYRF